MRNRLPVKALCLGAIAVMSLAGGCSSSRQGSTSAAAPGAPLVPTAVAAPTPGASVASAEPTTARAVRRTAGPSSAGPALTDSAGRRAAVALPPWPAPAPPGASVASAWIAAGARHIDPDGPPGPAPAGGPAPVRIEIPSIHVSAPVDPLGLRPDGGLDVPVDFSRTGWYTGMSVPGDVGPAIVVGHIDNKQGPAVFYRLRSLQPGAQVMITRKDGSQVVFVVERLQQVPKDAFPTDEVYGPTPGPTLRLITCGGSFDRSTGHYRDNTIVFAHMIAP